MDEKIANRLPVVYRPSLLEEVEAKKGVDKIKFVLENTMTGYLIVFFMIMFFFQFILYQIFIGSIIVDGSETTEVAELWASIFTVQPGYELYVWTYVTSMFSHGGYIHLLINSIVLFSFGLVAENDMGKKRFILFFFVMGLISSIGQLLAINMADLGLLQMYTTSQDFMFLGASGAISGIIGFVVIKDPNLKTKIIFFPFFDFKLFTGIIVFILISIFLVIYFGVGAFQIAHTAHLMGLIAGMVYGIKEYSTKGIKLYFYSHIERASKL